MLRRPRLLATIIVVATTSVGVLAPLPASAAPPPLFPYIVDIDANDLVYDSHRDQLLASVGSDDPVYGNSIVALDPETGDVRSHTFVGSEPGQLALAADGSMLYVGVDGANAVAQVRLDNWTVVRTMPLEPYIFAGTWAGDLEVDPFDPGRVVVSRHGPYSPAFAGLVVFQDGVPLPNTTGGHTGSSRIEFGSVPGRLYGFNDQHTGFDFFRNTVSATGVVSDDTANGLIDGFSTDLRFANGRLYASNGAVIDPEARQRLGRFDVSTTGDAFTIDFAAQRAYFLTGGFTGAPTLQVFNTETFLKTGEYSLRGTATPYVVGLEQTGPHRFAAHTRGDFATEDGQVVIFSLAPYVGADGEFTPLSPSRLLDTRDSAPIGPGESIEVQVTGRNGVPAEHVSAVVLNATVTEPTASGFVTIWPTGDERPVISSLNFVPGLTVPNLVTVAVSDDGKLSLFNSHGQSHVLLDIAGYYTTAEGNRGSRFVAVTPNRILDSRIGLGRAGRLGSGESMRLQVAGTPGVPTSGVTAAVLNVTAVDATEPSYVTVYPSHVQRPVASNLNTRPGPPVPNLVAVQLSPTGSVDLFNHAGSVDLVVDVAGYYVNDYSSERGRFVPVSPYRLADSREVTEGRLPAGYFVYYESTGNPFSAIVLNVTAIDPSESGFFTLYPYPGDPPTASNVNFFPHQVVPNAAIVATSPGFAMYHGGSGATHFVIDVFGVFI